MAHMARFRRRAHRVTARRRRAVEADLLACRVIASNRVAAMDRGACHHVESAFGRARTDEGKALSDRRCRKDRGESRAAMETSRTIR